jgi:trigger factor
MKTTIERLEDDRLKLDVEVPPDVLQHAVDHTLVHLAQDIRLPGFRPGKVPPQAVLARMGREAVVAETVKHYVGDWYVSAVMASGIRPVDEPQFDFDNVPGSSDTPFTFSATVQVAPKPTLPKLSSVEADKPELPDLKPYVEKMVNETLRAVGELKPTGEPAENGDEVLVDFTCSVNGENVRGASAVGYQARLGEGRLLEELERSILGKKAGETIEVPVNFPGDHPMDQLAGRQAAFTLTVREVMDLEIPDLTDEHARTVSEFKNAKELRNDIEKGIRNRLEEESKVVFRNNAVTALAEATEFTEPDVLVERRQNEIYQGLKQQLTQMGVSIEAYMDRMGQQPEELVADLQQQARTDVRKELCLLALAADENVEISDDDLKEEIRTHLADSDEDAEATIAQVFGSGRLDMLRQELLMQKTVDLLADKVKAKKVPHEDPANAKDETSS